MSYLNLVQPPMATVVFIHRVNKPVSKILQIVHSKYTFNMHKMINIISTQYGSILYSPVKKLVIRATIMVMAVATSFIQRNDMEYMAWRKSLIKLFSILTLMSEYSIQKTLTLSNHLAAGPKGAIFGRIRLVAALIRFISKIESCLALFGCCTRGAPPLALRTAGCGLPWAALGPARLLRARSLEDPLHP